MALARPSAGRLNLAPLDSNAKHDFDIQTLNARVLPATQPDLQVRLGRCENPKFVACMQAGQSLNQQPNKSKTHALQKRDFETFYCGGKDSFIRDNQADLQKMYQDVGFDPMQPPDAVVQAFYPWLASKAQRSRRSLNKVFTNVKMHWISLAMERGMRQSEAQESCPFRDDVTRRARTGTAKLVRDVDDMCEKKEYSMRPRTAYLIYMLALSLVMDLIRPGALKLFRCALAILLQYSFGPRSVELHDVILVSRLDEIAKFPDRG